ncbi:MAG: O-glycosyl hydrolase [Bacilli bacterium]|nr:O-glycosyl hydrolase [Bacilli bacterium]
MQHVQVWVTTVDQSKLLQPCESSEFIGEKETDPFTIHIDNNKMYQQMDGFGASFTDASAWLMFKQLAASARTEAMIKLFDPVDGIGMTFLRQPIGACDFNAFIYSNDDMPPGETDEELKHFSISHDLEYTIPAIKEALKLNPKIKIMISPWSPPGWMKTSDHMIGGTLKPEYYAVYAQYFVKFIQAYEQEGIPIYAVTIQNEPGYEPKEYPGMIMRADEQIRFIGEYLGPAFELNNVHAKIICYDHNWDVLDYTRHVLNDAKASPYIAGSAWHCYGGNSAAMTEIHDEFPDKDIWFTEASGGEWIPAFHDGFMNQMKDLIRSTRNWAKSVIWWNIALDEHNGPTVLSKSTCRGLLKVNRESGEIIYNLDYYTMGHISKFVFPGAFRIDSNTFEDDLETVAFQNLDGSQVLIISNRLTVDRTIKVQCGSYSFQHKLLAESAATYTWREVVGQKK